MISRLFQFVFLREQFAETRSGKKTTGKREIGDTQVRPLHIVTDFRPLPGGIKTAVDVSFLHKF